MLKRLWLLAIAMLCLSWAALVFAFDGNGPSSGTLTLSITPNVVELNPANSVAFSIALAGETCGATHTDPLDHKITVTGNGVTVGDFTVTCTVVGGGTYARCPHTRNYQQNLTATRDYYRW